MTPPKLELHLQDGFLYMNCIGKWDEDFIQNSYITSLNNTLANYTQDAFIPICDALHWIIPEYNATMALQKYHQQLAQRFKFSPVVLIAPSRFASLFEEVLSDFNLAGTGSLVKSFLQLDEAKQWMTQQNIATDLLLDQFPFQRSRTA